MPSFNDTYNYHVSEIRSALIAVHAATSLTYQNWFILIFNQFREKPFLSQCSDFKSGPGTYVSSEEKANKKRNLHLKDDALMVNSPKSVTSHVLFPHLNQMG